MQILGIHHVAIICSDYERSKHFYTQVLGLTVVQEIFRAERNSYKCDLAVAGVYQIELFSFPNPPARPSYPEAMGLRHLAFAVKDITAAAAHLTERNIAFEPIRIDEHTGKKFIFFADPDNLPIEFYEI